MLTLPCHSRLHLSRYLLVCPRFEIKGPLSTLRKSSAYLCGRSEHLSKAKLKMHTRSLPKTLPSRYLQATLGKARGNYSAAAHQAHCRVISRSFELSIGASESAHFILTKRKVRLVAPQSGNSSCHSGPLGRLQFEQCLYRGMEQDLSSTVGISRAVQRRLLQYPRTPR